MTLTLLIKKKKRVTLTLNLDLKLFDTEIANNTKLTILMSKIKQPYWRSFTHSHRDDFVLKRITFVAAKVLFGGVDDKAAV